MPEVGFVVAPPNALAERSRLFDAIGRLCDTNFVPEGTAGPAVAGRIEFGDPDQSTGTEGVPTLVLVEAMRASGDVFLQDAEEVPRAFRGRTIRDSAIGVLPPDIAARSQSVLARSGIGQPVWVRLSPSQIAAPAPAELKASETLRSCLRPGRFSDVLPLLAFVRRYAESVEADWIAPQASASFVIDDPNLHAVRYGFVHFRHLAQHAKANGYHVSFATIPLDLWWASQKAVRVFRESSDLLSLLVHGNDHVFRELDRTQSDCERSALLAEALRRVDRFERRYGVPVARVMAPPHGVCSHATAEALFRSGFEALCVSRTHPWLEAEPPDDVLAGSRPVHLVDDEFPLLLRYHIRQDPDDLPFRAFLGQPLIVYGHHDDLAEGPAILAETAAFIGDLGPVRWSSLDHIARSRFSLRYEESCLVVRPQTRRVEVTVTPSLDAISVDLPTGGPCGPVVVTSGRESFNGPGPHPVAAGTVTISILHQSKAEPLTADVSRRPSPWPVLRRALTEARDRLAPLYSLRP
ncbi:MAG: hypothetical protein ACXVRS_15745 [Gaiellaceae bacterium]